MSTHGELAEKGARAVVRVLSVLTLAVVGLLLAVIGLAGWVVYLLVHS
jgi:hypothetical protein